MKRYPLPKEYVKELNEHRYVEQATEWSVSFTAEFKQKAYDEYYRGKSMREIFTEAGFDVAKLGEKRLRNFRNQLMAKAKNPYLHSVGLTDILDGTKTLSEGAIYAEVERTSVTKSYTMGF